MPFRSKILLMPMAIIIGITCPSFNLPGKKLPRFADHVVPACFIYGYAENFVVAEIENAINNEVAYSSFEDNTTGNWTRNAAGIQSVAGKKSLTGTKYYSLGSGNITKSFSPAPGKNMIVSYWSRSGAQTVNGSASATAGRVVTIDGFAWTFYEHMLTAPASITISGSGLIDELRLYPHDANMTTYTYELGAGVSTICDINNNITYKEYDIFKRLALVRDPDYRILKKYCYGVAGQQENCTAYYYSIVKTGNYTRNNCGSGYQATSVTYTVPAGTYVSTVDQNTANQMAQNDLDANGQIYANINGACNLIYYSLNYSGYYYSQTCPPGATPIEIYVSVPAGMFTSIVDQTTANQQAQQYAQSYANTNGQCSNNISLTYDNWICCTTFYITLYNTSTGSYTFFEVSSSGSGILGNVPEGTYNIEFSNSSSYNVLYDVCGNSSSGSSVTLYGVQLNGSCSNIGIY